MTKTYIDTRTDYWLPTGFEAMGNALVAAEREDLIALIINNRYNDFVSEQADFRDNDGPVDVGADHDGQGRGLFSGGGKRVPYIGWFWRSTDFYHKRIQIGDCGEFIGIMENNKWDYPERALTDEECDQVIAIIDASMAASHQGGDLKKIQEDTYRELERLWPLFQTFTI